MMFTNRGKGTVHPSTVLHSLKKSCKFYSLPEICRIYCNTKVSPSHNENHKDVIKLSRRDLDFYMSFANKNIE